VNVACVASRTVLWAVPRVIPWAILQSTDHACPYAAMAGRDWDRGGSRSLRYIPETGLFR
jgi:hypothetical protein